MEWSTAFESMMLTMLLTLPGGAKEGTAAQETLSTAGGGARVSHDSGNLVKMYAMQLDMWAPPRDDVLIRYNLTNRFQKGDASEFSDVTVCMRARPIVLMSYLTFFSLATDQDSDVLHVYRRGQQHGFYYNGVRQFGFPNLTSDIGLRKWTHYCHVFQSGEYSFYIEGQLRVRGPISVPRKVPLTLKGIMVIGQEQDMLAGGYDRDQSFRGHVSQVNVWNRSLTAEEAMEQASCTKAELGNIFSTDREEVELLGGATLELVEPQSFCQSEVDYVIFPEARYLAESRLTCVRVGYQVYAPSNREQNALLHAQSLRFAKKCLSNYHLWIGVTDEEEENVWRKFTDGSITETPFVLNEPNGGTGENCMLMFLPSGLWVDTSCAIQWPACVPCQVDHTWPLRLRGFCFSNEAETYYELLGYKEEKPYLRGYYGYMVYMKEDFSWEMLDTTEGEVVGVLQLPSRDSYPIGRHRWTLSRSMCNHLAGTQLELSFSVCDNHEFTCANGDCIPKERRCNGKNDCSDMSDEDDCRLIVLPQGYRSQRPPDNDTEGLAIHLASNVEVLRFMEISDIRRLFNVEFRVEIRWNDPRPKYNNLGDTLEWNKLSAEDRSAVWKAKLNFPNVYDGNVKLMEEDLYLDKRDDPLPLDYNNVRMDAVYDGISAMMIQKLHYSGVFSCSFDVFYYPFDSQRCSLQLQLSLSRDLVKFAQHLSKVAYLEDPKLPAYLLKHFYITVHDMGNNETRYSTLNVEFVFSRRWKMIVLTVFLPTAMLQLVGYTTLYVNVALMDVRMAVSLTTLLVLYTLFSNMSDALPITAYVKMIDVWFFFCIFLLFSIIVVHTVVEHLVNLSENTKLTQVLPYDPRRPLEKSMRPTSPDADKLLFLSRYIMIPGIIIIFNVIYWGLMLSKG